MKLQENELIRQMSVEEIPECVEVIRTAFKTVADEFGFTEENAPYFTAFATDEARIKKQFEVEKRPMNVFLLDGKIVGYYSLEILSDKEAELNNLAVLPEYRHRGIGEKLVRYLFDDARMKGYERIKIGIVEENKVLRKWYESLGFIHTNSVKFDFFPFTCGYLEMELNED